MGESFHAAPASGGSQHFLTSCASLPPPHMAFPVFSSCECLPRVSFVRTPVTGFKEPSQKIQDDLTSRSLSYTHPQRPLSKEARFHRLKGLGHEYLSAIYP